MELRPCAPGVEYRGPKRVPVRRSSGAQAMSGITYRPRKRFFHLRTADYDEKLKHCQHLADKRRMERKAEQERIQKYGPDISVPDEDDGPLGPDCKVLKTLDTHDGEVRLYYRRKGAFSKSSPHIRIGANEICLEF